MLRTLTLLGTVAALFVAAGCGGGDDEGAAGDAAPAAETITVSATDFAFEPETLDVAAPGTYTLVLENEGAAPHALAIDGPGVDGDTGTVEPGATGEVTVELSEPGEYRLVCPVGDHADRGMTGTLVAEAR